MALQTFSVRILDKIGEALAGNLGLDAGMISDWITEGTRNVISKMPKSYGNSLVRHLLHLLQRQGL